MKLRTFITDDEHRDELVSHVYDTTYEVIRKGIDTLVVIDDSIVRGTTLEKSIIKMLDRLGPKKIVIVSSCPQIRYPDCYGIDMSKRGEFVAFRARRELLKEQGKDDLLGKAGVAAAPFFGPADAAPFVRGELLLPLLAAFGLGGQEYKRNIYRFCVFGQEIQYRVAVHNRHHDITDD